MAKGVARERRPTARVTTVSIQNCVFEVLAASLAAVLSFLRTHCAQQGCANGCSVDLGVTQCFQKTRSRRWQLYPGMEHRESEMFLRVCKELWPRICEIYHAGWHEQMLNGRRFADELQVQRQRCDQFVVLVAELASVPWFEAIAYFARAQTAKPCAKCPTSAQPLNFSQNPDLKPEHQQH